jgi:hypothetical protein
MGDTQQIPLVAPASPAENAGPGGTLSPDLVRQVADKVYALFLEDLRIERERRQLELMGWGGAQGGGSYGHAG